jgi:UPF0755 protein
MSKKIILILGIIILFIAIYVYTLFFGSNTKLVGEKSFIYIPTNSDYPAVLSILKKADVINDLTTFDHMAKRLSFHKNIKPGKYHITQGMGNYTLVNMFKGGKQTPVKLVINKLRTKCDIIKKLSSQLEADSTSLDSLLQDPTFLRQYDIDSNQIQCIIMPDTYQFYWNTDAKKAIEKIAKNYQKFWTDERKQKAKARSLSTANVITIASIVEEETNQEEDKLKIASTYLNRLKIGMPLQADPTLKFAINDFALKRLLTIHTQKKSPYNTYLNKGLPPGPICTPNRSTIDAVLNAPQTAYLYFCAREDFKGYSNFATTYAAHQQNAKKYQAALNKRNIK